MTDLSVLESPEAAAVSAPPTLDVRPLTPVIGAEIFGIDLRRPLAPETVAEIRAALLKWRVVFFRDQPLSNPQLLAFGRSEEHTSELQSLMRISYAVFCLTKKNTQKQHQYTSYY